MSLGVVNQEVLFGDKLMRENIQRTVAFETANNKKSVRDA
jgi:DNA-binding transcriptional regulator WhiA